MAFKINTNNVPQGKTLIQEGKYEMVISKVEEKVANSGSQYIQVELIIRNDVEQKYKNLRVWYSIYDTQATRQTGVYERNINNISKQVGIQDGAEFNSVEEWGQFLCKKPLLVTIKHKGYNGKTKEEVSFIDKSLIPNCNHSFIKEQGDVINNATRDEHDDLPF